MNPVSVAQAIAGVGGLRVTFKVPDDAPDPCSVELCIHQGKGSALDKLDQLQPAEVGAAECLTSKAAVRIGGRQIAPCAPGGIYRVTVRSAVAKDPTQTVVGRIVGT
ncbi:MAG TPA: hypothetical protein VFH61_14065 [Thermoleophilia bacterium]|nr:hypothetical protein [Thermoleophilia bacterium]